jgi:hypothetical protein
VRAFAADDEPHPQRPPVGLQVEPVPGQDAGQLGDVSTLTQLPVDLDRRPHAYSGGARIACWIVRLAHPVPASVHEEVTPLIAHGDD